MIKMWLVLYLYNEQLRRTHGGWQDVWIYNGKYAIIYSGNPEGKKGVSWPAMWNDAKIMYEVLVNKYNWHDESVYVLKYGSNSGDVVDGIYIDYNTDELFFDALDDIRKNSSVNDLFLFFEISHGNVDNFDGKSFSRLNYEIVGDGDSSIKSKRMVFVLTSCRSGSGIQYLHGVNRIVITSCSADEESWPWDEQKTMS